VKIDFNFFDFWYRFLGEPPALRAAVGLSAPAPTHMRRTAVRLYVLRRVRFYPSRRVAQNQAFIFLLIHKYPLPALKSQKKAL
jgi:hypothetical protein